MPTLPQSYYQHHPATMMTNSTLSSRGRSLTPPSFKQNPRLSSMNHLPPQDLYSPYYPHPALYTDPAYYRTYGDPYLMQRIPPPPPPFLPPTSPPPSSSSRAYRNMHSSSDFDRYPSSMSHRRKKRSRSRSRRRYEVRLLLSLSFFAIKIDLYIVLLISSYSFFPYDHHYYRFISR